MPKKYQKKKSSSVPNATGPKYRSPSSFIGNRFSDSKFGGSKFSGKSSVQKGFSAQTYKKTQHKG